MLRRVNDLEQILAREPSTSVWNDVVAWFDVQLGAGASIVDAVSTTQAALATWPPSIVRPLPYWWIFRLCVDGSFAPARLADTLSLGDRWALHPEVGITDFDRLSRRQLDCLATTRDLPALRHLDVSCRTDEHPHSPGTMLARVDALPAFLAAAPFAGLVTLDLSFTSVTIDEIAEILAEHSALRALSLGACESDGFDDDALAALLELPALAQLEHLELQRMGSGGAAAIRAILGCPHLADLRILACKLDPTLLGEDGLHADEFRELLAASDLTPTVQATLREQYADKYGLYAAPDRFAAIFPGEPGACFDAPDEEDEE
jgi:hypothetical protein